MHSYKGCQDFLSYLFCFRPHIYAPFFLFLFLIYFIRFIFLCIDHITSYFIDNLSTLLYVTGTLLSGAKETIKKKKKSSFYFSLKKRVQKLEKFKNNCKKILDTLLVQTYILQFYVYLYNLLIFNCLKLFNGF